MPKKKKGKRKGKKKGGATPHTVKELVADTKEAEAPKEDVKARAVRIRRWRAEMEVLVKERESVMKKDAKTHDSMHSHQGMSISKNRFIHFFSNKRARFFQRDLYHFNLFNKLEYHCFPVNHSPMYRSLLVSKYFELQQAVLHPIAH